MFIEFERDADAEVGVRFEDFVTAAGMYVYTNEGDRSVTVPDVAMAFNTTPELAREALEAHPWIYIGEDGRVMSDGE